MKFLQTVQLDESDSHIFDRPAQPGEWAVPGTFTLWDVAPDALTGPDRQAFEHGFLGTASLGWTSLVRVAEMPPDQWEAVVACLADHLVSHYGAPDTQTARPVAVEEVTLTNGLCEHPVATLIAVDREVTEEGILESYRVVGHPEGFAATLG